MSRPPIGDRAMTPAERQKRHRDKIRGEKPRRRVGERAAELAAETRVSKRTVYRDAQFARACDIIAEHNPGLIRNLRNGTARREDGRKPTRADVIYTARLLLQDD
jgi:predicted DNA-binding transcriptional regulator YafY